MLIPLSSGYRLAELVTSTWGLSFLVPFADSCLVAGALVRSLVREYKFTLPKTEIRWNMALAVYPSAGEDHQTPRLPLVVEKISD